MKSFCSLSLPIPSTAAISGRSRAPRSPGGSHRYGPNNAPHHRCRRHHRARLCRISRPVSGADKRSVTAFRRSRKLDPRRHHGRERWRPARHLAQGRDGPDATHARHLGRAARAAQIGLPTFSIRAPIFWQEPPISRPCTSASAVPVSSPLTMPDLDVTRSICAMENRFPPRPAPMSRASKRRLQIYRKPSSRMQKPAHRPHKVRRKSPSIRGCFSRFQRANTAKIPREMANFLCRFPPKNRTRNEMQMPFPIAIFSVIFARRCGRAAVGLPALVEDRAQVIVDGRRGNEECRVRQDKAPALPPRIADGKPLSAHCFFGRLDSAKRYAVVPALRQHTDIPDVLWHQSAGQGEGAHVG